MKRLFFILNVFLLVSCSSDDEVRTNIKDIVGVWEKSSDISAEIYLELEKGNYDFVLQYKFLDDSTFESFSFVRNSDTDNIIGYRSHSEGSFFIKGNRMNLNYNQYNSDIEASQLVDSADLVLIDQDVDWSFNFSINNDELLFDFDPCGPYENCIGELNLKRVKKN
ncbi:hypothetical protein SAMN05660776_0728 [Salegentibacter holothuriorum]|uniref:Lipocalin-like domain-containing protein n=1 Tax=Salegentibacter holothuriorum TaxID=241145 RepID=A0A1T5AMV7_9FLAO|nr:hypothetical protein [Salegentibacter holothuriorum]SKB36361.1 hypothetical protein SAMN05660776_0728 [Salegentibacter holothuriorum]